MIFRQLFDTDSSTYTYILVDEVTHKAAIVDSVIHHVDRDLSVLAALNGKLEWILDTHVHADHITGAFELRKKTKAQIALGKAANLSCADRLLDDGDEILIGNIPCKVLSTPGHTNGCTSYYVNNSMIFTGDALLIGGCGRTDFQEGSSEKLFHSIREKIFGLPDSTIVYPAHDYKEKTSTTIGEEKKSNPRLKLSNTKEQFIDIMKNLKLDEPKNMHKAVPANIKCGQIP